MNPTPQTPVLDAETLQLFTDSVARYGQDKYGFDSYRARLRATPAYSPQAWSDYAQMGWLGAALPVDDGGFGSDPKAVAALMRYAGERLALEPLFASAVVCGRLLALCGATGAAGSAAMGLAGAVPGLGISRDRRRTSHSSRPGKESGFADCEERLGKLGSTCWWPPFASRFSSAFMEGMPMEGESFQRFRQNCLRMAKL